MNKTDQHTRSHSHSNELEFSPSHSIHEYGRRVAALPLNGKCNLLICVSFVSLLFATLNCMEQIKLIPPTPNMAVKMETSSHRTPFVANKIECECVRIIEGGDGKRNPKETNVQHNIVAFASFYFNYRTVFFDIFLA